MQNNNLMHYLTLGRGCGHCSIRAKSPIQLACLKRRWTRDYIRTSCGFWRRRYSCYRLGVISSIIVYVSAMFTYDRPLNSYTRISLEYMR